MDIDEGYVDLKFILDFIIITSMTDHEVYIVITSRSNSIDVSRLMPELFRAAHSWDIFI